MSSGAVYVAGLLMSHMNCSFSCAYVISVQLRLLGAARFSIFSIPIAVRSLCCSVMMSSKLLCVIGGVSDNGVGVSEISMPISSRCCSMLSVEQSGVSAVGRCSGPPWNRPQCGCWCLCGLTSSYAATLAASPDCSCLCGLISSPAAT